MPRIDPHSYADSLHPRVTHVSLDWFVDFEHKEIRGTATLKLAGTGSGPIDLDTKGLRIETVTSQDGGSLAFELSAEEVILGSRLRIELTPLVEEICIGYSTSPDAIALQWLEPGQTEGKTHPFLFSQCQAIHARTMLPVQDTPRLRITYDARVNVPADLTAVMSAEPGGITPASAPGRRAFQFAMPQAIPPYLMALAVGRLESRDLSPRSRVWAEPETADAAAWEFAGIENMITRAEELFGPYEWDRYDMLVLPPSFPYGGMENPRMTFLTPTLLSGDRSLVDVVAHELAHSWTGNLVTNATMDHFWLNEGFTVYAERRILEALHGTEEASLAWAIGQKALEQAVRRFGADSPLTQLRTHLEGIDPDDAFSSVPYEKGARFLVRLEQEVGREKFDSMLRAYMARFRFTSITTEEFMDFLEGALPGAAAAVRAEIWLHQPGIPADAPVFQSRKLEEIQSLAAKWNDGTRPDLDAARNWKASELLVYLQNLPRPLGVPSLEWLDGTFKLTGQGNHELLVEWLVIAATSDYEPVFERLEKLLTRVGRMKYLRPLYMALGATPRTRALAKNIFQKAAAGYHILSRRVAASVMETYAG